MTGTAETVDGSVASGARANMPLGLLLDGKTPAPCNQNVDLCHFDVPRACPLTTSMNMPEWPAGTSCATGLKTDGSTYTCDNGQENFQEEACTAKYTRQFAQGDQDTVGLIKAGRGGNLGNMRQCDPLPCWRISEEHDGSNVVNLNGFRGSCDNTATSGQDGTD